MTESARVTAQDVGESVSTDSFLDPAVAAPQNWDALSAWLSGQGMNFSPEPAPPQFAGGFGNLNYRVEIDGRPMVLRRPPAGPLPPGGNDMGREYRVLSRLWQAFPLAPRATLFCDDEAVLGAPFFLMEYRPGLVVRGALPAILEGRGAALGRMMIDTLAAFQAVDPASVGLDELGRPDGFLERAVEGWIKRIHVATDDSPPATTAELAAWLRANRVPDGAPTLLHNDFKLDNIILAADDPVRPVAVLDWDMCTRGDPLFDFATLLSYWVQADDPPEAIEFARMPTHTPGFLSRAEATAFYAEITGRDLSDFQFHRVLCLFKLGVVLLQLYARYRRGITKDERFEPLGRIAEATMEFALEVTRGKAT